MRRLNRIGKVVLFLALAATLLCVCAAALADTHVGDHVWDSGEKITDANCDHPARYKYTCTICGATREENVGASDPSKHDWGEWIIDKAPTCTETGARHRVCKNNVHHTETDEPKALGHDFEWVVDKEATCTATGFRRQVCKRCGLETASEVIPMTAHKPGNWETIKAPTCTEQGQQGRKCTVCGTVTETNPLAALGHDWGKYEVTKAPTCTAKGEQTRVCSRDSSHKETQEVAALGHDWGEWTVSKAPTCTAKGTETRVCKRDPNHTEKRDVDATGHKWDNGTVTTAATCDKEGVKTYTCQKDPSHTKTEKIPALGHKWDNGKITKQPTWKTTGEIVYTCQNNPAHTRTETLASITKPNNTICAFGPRLRESYSIIYPTPDLWYMYTPFSVEEIANNPSAGKFELIASNTDIVGELTISIQDGQIVVDYQLYGDTVKITYEFFTILNSITELDKYEPEELRSLALQRRQPIDINEYFNGDDKLVLYFCSRCDYSYNKRFKDLDYESAVHQQLLTKMLGYID